MGLKIPSGWVAASIGPVTSDALRKHGVTPAIEAKTSDIPGLVEAGRKYLAKKK
jgi:uroporphyrinogen III methyltransferase/synthase